jgi:hypothetical protein
VGVEINGLEELQRAERRRISGIRRIVSVPAVVADGPQDETVRCPRFPNRARSLRRRLVPQAWLSDRTVFRLSCKTHLWLAYG